MFVLGKPFQPCPKFLGKASSLPKEVLHFRQAPVLPANIRLGWKGLPGTNTVAYYKY